MKTLLPFGLVLLLASAAQAQAPRSATDRAALIHSYQVSIREQATAEARELARLLGLNESEIQLVKEFATARLQTEMEAQASSGNPADRHALVEEAAATFQSRVTNILTDRQMQAYLNLLASQTPAPAPMAEVAPPPKPRAKAKTTKRPLRRAHSPRR